MLLLERPRSIGKSAAHAVMGRQSMLAEFVTALTGAPLQPWQRDLIDAAERRTPARLRAPQAAE